MSSQDVLSLETHCRVISGELKTRLRLEECITESDLVGVFQERVRLVVRVDVEEDWHVDLLARVKPLLLETEALDLIEVCPGLEGHNIVGGDPVNWPEMFSIQNSLGLISVVTCLWGSWRCRRRERSPRGGRAPRAAGDGSSIFRNIIRKYFQS